MGLKKIIIENYNLPRYGRRDINMDFSKIYILEEEESIEKDISSILQYVLPEAIDELYGNPQSTIEDPEEVSTLIIQTEKYTYTKIKSCESVIVDQLVNNNTREQANFGELRQFRDSLDNIIILDQFRFCGPCYECTPLFNSVIPAIFQEVSEVYPDGAARVCGESKTVVFPLDTMGGGYRQVVNFLYALWKVMDDENCTVYMNFWWNHLHPVLREWIWNNILTRIKEESIKGTLIVDKYEIV